MKKDLSSSSQQEEEDEEEPGSSQSHHHIQSVPDGLRLRSRNVKRVVESNQNLVRKVKDKMKKGAMNSSRSHNNTSSGSSSFSNVNEYFNDDEEEDLVIIDSDEDDDGTNRKRNKRRLGKEVEIEHVTKFARSDKSELIELIYGTGNGKVDQENSKFVYHNDSVKNEESDDDLDETSSLNPIIPDQMLPKVQTKRPNKVSAHLNVHVL